MAKIVKAIGTLDPQMNKGDLMDLAAQHASEIVSTEQYDLLKVYIEFKRYEIYLKTLIDSIKIEALNEAKVEERKDFEYGSARIILYQRKKYDYSSDQSWKELTDEINQIKEEKKEREQMLKGINGAFEEILDEETGEIQRIFAPSVEYIETLMVKHD